MLDAVQHFQWSVQNYKINVIPGTLEYIHQGAGVFATLLLKSTGSVESRVNPQGIRAEWV